MKTIQILSLAAGFSFLASCASPGNTASKTSGAASSSSVATSGIKPYPLNTCIVTDNKLGSMGAVVTKTYKNQEVKFCCKACVKKFDANPEKYLKKI